MELNSMTIEALRTTGKRYTKNDNITKGLLLRIESSGSKTWYFRGKLQGKRVLRRLGVYPRMTVRGARREVASLHECGLGNPRPFTTLDEMLVGYLRSANVKLVESRLERSLRKYPADTENGVFSILPDRPEAVQVSDITQYVDLIKQKTTLADGTIRNMLSLLKRAYSYYMLRGHVTTNPISVWFDLNRSLRGQDQMLKPTPVRERYLEKDQIALALDVLDSEMRDVVRIALLTGCRRGELHMLHSSEICLASGVVTFPAKRKKNGRLHKLALSTLAQDILKPRLFGGGFVFPVAAGMSSTYITGVLTDKCSFTPHDIRRTMSECLGQLGCPAAIITKILSHTAREEGAAKVTLQYMREHSNYRLDEQRIWLNELANHYSNLFPSFSTILERGAIA